MLFAHALVDVKGKTYQRMVSIDNDDDDHDDADVEIWVNRRQARWKFSFSRSMKMSWKLVLFVVVVVCDMNLRCTIVKTMCEQKSQKVEMIETYSYVPSTRFILSLSYLRRISLLFQSI